MFHPGIYSACVSQSERPAGPGCSGIMLRRVPSGLPLLSQLSERFASHIPAYRGAGGSTARAEP